LVGKLGEKLVSRVFKEWTREELEGAMKGVRSFDEILEESWTRG